jgi:polyisoprenoid-binding protein YceI
VAKVTYAIESGRVVVTARSAIHDTRTVWSKVSGTVEVDPDDPGAGAAANVTVDMRDFDAGDRLKNWKLKSDLDPDRWPTATFRLTGLVVEGREPLRATATGTLAWHGRETPVRASGEGRLTPDAVSASATFDLDVRTLGIEPPKILFLKVESIVRVEVTLSARRAA